MVIPTGGKQEVGKKPYEKPFPENDVFDKIVNWAVKYRTMKWFIPIYARFKEFLLYALMGLGTVLIAIWTYSLFTETLGWHVLYGNALSWVFATLFAFLTNRKWVFTTHETGVKAFFQQMGSFAFGRFLTLLIEEWILYFFVAKLGFPNMAVKWAAQVIVISANYVFGKFFVFSGGRGRGHVLIHGHLHQLKQKMKEEEQRLRLKQTEKTDDVSGKEKELG